MSTLEKKWESLTWDDLAAWAGSRSVAHGRKYQRGGRVKDLVMSKEGRLLANVTGGERYATSVWLTDSGETSKSLESKCTCPVGYRGCKHAVAVVAEYLEQVATDSDIPIADPKDKRWARLADDAISHAEEEELEEKEEGTEARSPSARQRQTKPSDWDQKIRRHIAAKNHEELAELVWSLTQRFPELRDEFRERILLGEGDVDRLVAEARQELRSLTAQPGWRNHWSDEGNIPDFSKLKHRLERMLELGHPDAVVKLGHEIMERGLTLAGESHDEGETGMEVASCMEVVFKAVAQSSLPPEQQLLFSIDARLKDDYDIIGEAGDIVMDKKFDAEGWSKVADEMARRLKSWGPRKRDTDYHRDRVSGWLATALENSGRHGEIPAIYEREARITFSYQRLVNHLIERKQYDEVQRWAREGIEKTLEKFPGIAAALGKALGEVAELQGQWKIVAAHAALDFFDAPGKESFSALVAAAEKAKCAEPVKAAALKFLETGIAPVRGDAGKKGIPKPVTDASWPLPIPDYLLPLLRDSRRGAAGSPHYDVLIDMAIADKRHDEVLKWYDVQRAAQNSAREYGQYGYGNFGDRVAEAVAITHPQRALEIYRQRITDSLGGASIAAYEQVASYLRKARPIFTALARAAEWNQLVADIRLRHRNRPRFMEILDSLEGKTVLQSQRNRR